jgi:hypothetical protein
MECVREVGSESTTESRANAQQIGMGEEGGKHIEELAAKVADIDRRTDILP